jgi:translation elongation factor EF-4
MKVAQLYGKKLQLNDASLVFLPESSAALGLVSVVDFRDVAHGNHSRNEIRTRVQYDRDYHYSNVSYLAYTERSELH